MDDGRIAGFMTGEGHPFVGGSVIVLSAKDGAIRDAYHYYV